MGAFEPVRTLADLNSLNEAEIMEGYMSAERGDPEPGPNRGRAFWHVWRNRMIDLKVLPPDDASAQLAHEYIKGPHPMWNALIYLTKVEYSYTNSFRQAGVEGAL